MILARLELAISTFAGSRFLHLSYRTSSYLNPIQLITNDLLKFWVTIPSPSIRPNLKPAIYLAAELRRNTLKHCWIAQQNDIRPTTQEGERFCVNILTSSRNHSTVSTADESALGGNASRLTSLTNTEVSNRFVRINRHNYGGEDRTLSLRGQSPALCQLSYPAIALNIRWIRSKSYPFFRQNSSGIIIPLALLSRRQEVT